MKVTCFDIDWDTDGLKTKLPKKTIVEVESFDEVVDALSDKFGWCINSLKIKEEK
ncbi:hypothetical protein LCGC14_1315710 [marine sediment metagenome]|uniref:Uncharacterized protein n=1 Tax=marine sediment metagenome TaxID=412755 RepID=A0A0F9KL38_9ZZZZ